MVKKQTWMIKMHTGKVPEYLAWPRPPSRSFRWTIDRSEAIEVGHLQAAWMVIEEAGFAGMENIRPVRVD